MSTDRDLILERLRQDLIGPMHSDELLVGDRPSDRYVTGILWPRDIRNDGENDERLGTAGSAEATDEDSEAEQAPPSLTLRPATAGLSFALRHSAGGCPQFNVLVQFGVYQEASPEDAANADTVESAATDATRDASKQSRSTKPNWQRIPFSERLTLPARNDVVVGRLPEGVELHVRALPWQDSFLITATLVNSYRPDRDASRNMLEAHTLFQVELHVEAHEDSELVARPSRHAEVDDDDRVASVIYRDAKEYATGHTCSAYWELKSPDSPGRVGTTWIPSAIVPDVSPAGHRLFQELESSFGQQLFSAKWLSDAKDDQLAAAARALASAYAHWIALQEQKAATLDPELALRAMENLERCTEVERRLGNAAELLESDPQVALAFRLANRAMFEQFQWDPDRRARGEHLRWRPFQLGFILLSLASLAKRDHPERETMDLLWFPTGGGKTEAYLALVAFIAILRRIKYGEAGVTAVMRYTLRLLTTQQFARATALMMACEALRRGVIPGVPTDTDLGTTPFSIGLWVGGDASPNRFDEASKSLRGDTSVSSPKQIAKCPACAKLLLWQANRNLERVEVRCGNAQCVLHFGEEVLPIHTVDSDVYRERPTLLIGTIDKFAQIVRRRETGDLFGVGIHEPPDLVLQDELHLISGPLGTVAGLYETALDLMFERPGSRVKIIGSTATIRRASDQVKALFDRATCQFPPAAVDQADSGFAVVDRALPGRLYCAVSTAGRSAKFTLQAVSASLLQSSSAALDGDPARMDPYWTLVTYFNSLRELGGALVLMQDDVRDAIELYAGVRAEVPRELHNIEELTSRRTQQEILAMLTRVADKIQSGDPLDVVLATNMLSVGVDIPRLGLMLVNGQPKATAEYIQATSRVGRGKVQGLVVNVMNNGKARDRSRFETFASWHGTLYRDVEATSVTPFASRSRDRSLHAVLVASVRHLVPGLQSVPALTTAHKAQISELLDRIEARVNRIDRDETRVRRELSDLLIRWLARGPKEYWNKFKPGTSLLQDAERAATLKAQGRQIGEAWPTMNNMRSVEPSTPIRFVRRLALRQITADGEIATDDDLETNDDQGW